MLSIFASCMNGQDVLPLKVVCYKNCEMVRLKSCSCLFVRENSSWIGQFSAHLVAHLWTDDITSSCLSSTSLLLLVSRPVWIGTADSSSKLQVKCDWVSCGGSHSTRVICFWNMWWSRPSRFAALQGDAEQLSVPSLGNRNLSQRTACRHSKSLFVN